MHAIILGLILIASSFVFTTPASAQPTSSQATPTKDWAFNATIIEACSCPMFCQCYFNSGPSAHSCHPGSNGERFCRFNNAYRVNKGTFGSVKLDGMKFWLYGDLGGDFSKGHMDWAMITFEPSATKEQREAIKTIIGQAYPVQWNSFTEGKDAPIEWKADKDHAEAKLNGGKTAEVILKRNQGMTDEPIVIKNLKYWGAPRNDGFILMANEVEAVREGAKTFEFKGTNGFMITFDITSKDAGKSGY